MPDTPSYQQISVEDQKKAQVFFEKARAVADANQYEFAIEMQLNGLNIDPNSVEAHQALRDVAMRRKANGGKALGMFKAMQLRKPTKDDKTNMLNAEKLLAYDPGNTDFMLSMMQNAHRAGYFDTVMWIGPILERANADSPKPEFNKFITLKDIYKSLEQWKPATRACQHAAALRPDDMDLQTELKNLGALVTMTDGKYDKGGGFTESIRDPEKQRKLLVDDMDVRSMDVMQRAIAEAEEQLKADPDEPGKIMRLVDALTKTEQLEEENRAIDLLQQAFDRTKQFRYRHRIGQIQLAQMARTERALRADAEASPDDEAIRTDLRQFLHDKVQRELKEYQTWADNYPTETGYRFEVAKRLFMLRQFDEAIPILQAARSDPKYRIEAQVLLGRAFLGAGFVDEAADTLGDLIKSYQLSGDTRSIEMHYYYGNVLEQKGDREQAMRMYSRVAQWNFNYKDVQARLRQLREKPKTNGNTDLEEV